MLGKRVRTLKMINFSSNLL